MPQFLYYAHIFHPIGIAILELCNAHQQYANKMGHKKIYHEHLCDAPVLLSLEIDDPEVL